MKTNNAFWDTSAIVPLCTPQDSSFRARQLQRKYKRIFVCWETLVEIHSALNRLLREGKSTKDGHERAWNQVAFLQKAWTEMPPTDKLRNRAVDLLESYPLRAGDALQLAAALIWCNGKPRNRVFVCFDLLLADVAAQAGFTVIGLK
jgi:hypothetical protein